jgi:hypothetical protein
MILRLGLALHNHCVHRVLSSHFTNRKRDKQMLGPHFFWLVLFLCSCFYVFLKFCCLLILCFATSSYYHVFVVLPCFILLLHQFVNRNWLDDSKVGYKTFFNLIDIIEMDVKSFKELKIVEKEKIMNMWNL